MMDRVQRSNRSLPWFLDSRLHLSLLSLKMFAKVKGKRKKRRPSIVIFYFLSVLPWCDRYLPVRRTYAPPPIFTFPCNQAVEKGKRNFFVSSSSSSTSFVHLAIYCLFVGDQYNWRPVGWLVGGLAKGEWEKALKWPLFSLLMPIYGRRRV